RLTFKVPSREEHDRRQKALEEEKKKKLAARTSTRKSAALRKLAAGKRGASKDSPDAPVAPGQIEPSAAPMPQSAQALPTDATAEALTLAQEQNLIVPFAMLSHNDVEIIEQPPEASTAPEAVPLSSLTSPLPAEATTSMPPPSNTSSSVVQQPNNPQTPDPTGLAFSAPKPESAARQLPANNTTTQAQASSAKIPNLHGPTSLSPSRMRRGDLPVFTSSGAIPFGSVPHGNGVSTSMHPDAAPKEGSDAAEVDIWEVPDTPARR
ncbi:histone deacetylase, partial [Cryomyces antarcticus]